VGFSLVVVGLLCGESIWQPLTGAACLLSISWGSIFSALILKINLEDIVLSKQSTFFWFQLELGAEKYDRVIRQEYRGRRLLQH
jgi:hypothetical protein